MAMAIKMQSNAKHDLRNEMVKSDVQVSVKIMLKNSVFKSVFLKTYFNKS